MSPRLTAAFPLLLLGCYDPEVSGAGGGDGGASCTVNLIANTDFSTGIQGWNVDDDSVLRHVVLPDERGGVAEVCRTPDGEIHDSDLSLDTPLPNPLAGTTYRLSGLVRRLGSTASMGGPRILLTAGGSTIDVEEVIAQLPEAWQPMSVTYTVAAGGDELDPTFRLMQAAQDLCFQIDDVCFEGL